MRIYIICVGRLKEKYFMDACAEYIKRLKRDCDLKVLELEEQRLPSGPSTAQIRSALEKEAVQIRSKLPRGSRLIALCKEGEKFGSEALANRLMRYCALGSSGITFLVGGSYGLDEGLKSEADLRLSMSDMTFPHHLARVMLLEQIYRSFRIVAGSEYHK